MPLSGPCNLRAVEAGFLNAPVLSAHQVLDLSLVSSAAVSLLTFIVLPLSSFSLEKLKQGFSILTWMSVVYQEGQYNILEIGSLEVYLKKVAYTIQNDQAAGGMCEKQTVIYGVSDGKDAMVKV